MNQSIFKDQKMKILKNQIMELEKPKNAIIKAPKNEECLLFETFDYLTNLGFYERSIHLIKLIGDGNIINIKYVRDGHNKNNGI